MEWIPTENFHEILRQMPLVCVDVAVYNHKNEVLLLKRANEPAKNQFWLPGGRVHKGEDRRAAARRKVREECGIEVDFLAELFTSETIFDDGPGGTPVHSVNTVYFTMVKDAQIRLDDQSQEHAWRSPAEWERQDLHAYVSTALKESGRLLI